MSEIRFGTDGWRATIAEDFTFANVRAVSQALADHLRRHDLAGDGVVVGYDTRFLSGSFAGAIAEVLAANEIHVALTSGPTPTPAVSFSVLEQGAGAGVMVTASHNPARWNGIKLRTAAGMAIPRAVAAELEQAVPGIITGERVQHMPLGEAEASGMVERLDPRPAYFAALREMVDMAAIRAAGLNVLVDTMYGATAGWMPELVGDGPTRVRELHAQRNPSFPGMRAPEPVASNLAELMAQIEQNGYDAGFAMDADGDRFALIDEGGRYVTSLQTFALLVRYLLEERGERGPIVRSVTSTRMIDRLGGAHDCPVYETPVGFSHLGARMQEVDAMVAGEESGGFAFRAHLPERDGLLSGLLMLDYLTRTGKQPRQLLAELHELLGPHEYDRVDVTLRNDEREAIVARVAEAQPETIAGLAVTGRDTTDGFRFTMEGGWWLLLRFSGTEPLLRVYAEMPSQEQVRTALHTGQELAGTTL